MEERRTGMPEGRRLSCAVCLRPVPPEVEITREGREHVRYFCGLDCYRQWHERKEDGPGGGARSDG